MRSPKINAFAVTLQHSEEWLQDIATELGGGDLERALLAFRVAVHALRDRLPVDEAVHFGAQMPMLLRGAYYDGWRPAGKPERMRTLEEFYDHVARELVRADDDPAALVDAVFKVLASRISHGEVEDVKAALPEVLRDLWPEPVT